jgi:hypothetical protein
MFGISGRTALRLLLQCMSPEMADFVAKGVDGFREQ